MQATVFELQFCSVKILSTNWLLCQEVSLLLPSLARLLPSWPMCKSLAPTRHAIVPWQCWSLLKLQFSHQHIIARHITISITSHVNHVRFPLHKPFPAYLNPHALSIANHPRDLQPGMRNRRTVPFSIAWQNSSSHGLLCCVA